MIQKIFLSFLFAIVVGVGVDFIFDELIGGTFGEIVGKIFGELITLLVGTYLGLELSSLKEKNAKFYYRI
jgi:hypothetical protein